MPPKQATLGKFFQGLGSNAKAPSREIASGAKNRDDARKQEAGEAAINNSEAVASRKERKSRRKNAPLPHAGDGIPEADSKDNAPALAKGSELKRPFSDGPAASDSAASKSDSDEEPVQKRPRRNRRNRQPSPGGRSITPTSGDGDGETVGTKLEKPAASSRPQKQPRKASAEALPKANGDDEISNAKEDSSDVVSEQEDADASEEEVDEKPEVAAKAREKIQSTLQTIEKDPYPDWPPGEPVPYAALCATFSLIELTTKRLVILSHCSQFLRQVLRLTPGDLLATVQLMINKLAADYAGIELGIGESLIMKAIGEATGRSLAVIKADQNDIGDLGLVAAKSRSNQPTMFKPKPLTVRGVHDALLAIATTMGQGAQARKVALIKKLLSTADADSAAKEKGAESSSAPAKAVPSEAKYIVRFLEGKLRLGLADKTVLLALAQAMVAHEAYLKGGVPSTDQLARGEAILKTVYSELPSYEVIIPAMIEHGISNLQDHCKLHPGVPLKPMLAKPTKSITEVLNRFEKHDFSCEFKYDGERAQIHYMSPQAAGSSGGSATLPASKAGQRGVKSIFSRNSEDLSKKYPDILDKLDTWVKPGTESFVLDCETVAWDVVEKKVLPFQQLMTRKRKDVKVEDVKVKVCVFAFDLLFLNGQPAVHKSLRERRELMRSAFEEVEGEFAFARCMNTSDLEEISAFLEESMKASCEGLMVKMLDGEESWYEPSKRSRNWLKVKKDYLSGLGDSLDLVVLGAYYGKGKRTSVYGAFLLACYNTASQTYETVCNLGTGFSEALLEELHAQLSEHTIDKPKPFYSHSAVPKDQPDVWFEPKFVWEVKCADITLSPRYKAAAGLGVDKQGSRGISLRFPRFIKQRDDKKPDDATTSRLVAEMYRKQESVAKDTAPAVDDDFEY